MRQPLFQVLQFMKSLKLWQYLRNGRNLRLTPINLVVVVNRSIENDHDEETEKLKNSFEQKVSVMHVVSFVTCYLFLYLGLKVVCSW